MMKARSLDDASLGERLRSARATAGLTQEALASQLGVARTTIVAMERGERRPRADELVTLARILNTSVNRLVRPTAVHVDLQAEFRRTLKKTGAEQAANEAVSLLSRLAGAYAELEERLDRVAARSYPAPISVARGSIAQQAEDAALQIRTQLGLGLAPIQDLVSIAETQLGLRVFIRPVDSSIAGVYAFHERVGACVLLNARQPRERRVMSLGHEIGHFMSDRASTVVTLEGDVGTGEAFPDAFARSLLLPAAAVRRRFTDTVGAEGKFSPRHLITLAAESGVSMEAYCRRLEDLDLVRRGTHDMLRERGLGLDAQRMVLGDRAPDAPQPMPLRLTTLAAEASEAGLLTEGQLADLLGLDRLDVRELLDAMRPLEED